MREREKARYSAEGRCSLDNPVQCKTRQTDLGDVVLSTKTTRQIDLGDVGVSAGPTRHFTLPCLPDPRFVRTKLTAVAEVSQAKVGRTVSKHQNRSKYTTEGKGRRGKGLSKTLGKKTDRGKVRWRTGELISTERTHPHTHKHTKTHTEGARTVGYLGR